MWESACLQSLGVALGCYVRRLGAMGVGMSREDAPSGLGLGEGGVRGKVCCYTKQTAGSCYGCITGMFDRPVLYDDNVGSFYFVLRVLCAKRMLQISALPDHSSW